MRTKTFIRPVAVGALAHENGICDAKDCTVRSLANAASIPYTVAHAAMKDAGRREMRGADISVYGPAYMKMGFELVGLYGTTDSAVYNCYTMRRKGVDVSLSKGITLGRMMEKLQRGRYIVIVRGHALAVVNGKVIDNHAVSSAKSVVALFKMKED